MCSLDFGKITPSFQGISVTILWITWVGATPCYTESTLPQ